MTPKTRSSLEPYGEGDTKLTKAREGLKKFVHSLYVRLSLIIILAIMIAVGTYFTALFLSNGYIEDYYITEKAKNDREIAYLRNLQDYVTRNGISSDDTKQITDWANENKYVYFLIYKDNELFFSSDMIPKPDTGNTGDTADGGEGDRPDSGATGDSPESKPSQKPSGGDDSLGSGITVTYPTRDELKKYAEENGLFELEMKDGPLLVAVAEFTEYLYYDIANIASLLFAMLVLIFVLIFYFRRIISRIKRLDRNVMEVASGDINRPVTAHGYDEIARLSANVESMRSAIIKSMEEERDARQANAELITAMSHDIRTPLTVLLGYLEMMKNEADSDKMRTYAAVSENTAMRLKNLSDDMFNYFLAYGSTKESFNIEEYDAQTLFEQMLSEPMILLNEKGYDIEYTFDTSRMQKGAMVLTDAPKLMRIVDNIFSNLAKYADKDAPVCISAEADGERFVLQIKNRVRRDKSKTESNGIGLKTCSRLSSFIAESFDYSEDDGVFSVRLTIRLSLPEVPGVKI